MKSLLQSEALFHDCIHPLSYTIGEVLIRSINMH